VRNGVLNLLRLVAELVLLPVRLAVGLGGLVLLIGGVFGALAWTVQLLIGGGGGPLSPGLMWLASIAAVPAGIVMLALCGAGTDAGRPRPAAVVTPAQERQPGADLAEPAGWGEALPVLDSGTGLTITPSTGDVEMYLAALENDLAGEAVASPSPYHRHVPLRRRSQASRRPL
jgi:hypothetical protein